MVHTVQKPEHMIYVDKTAKEISQAGVLLPHIDYVNIAINASPIDIRKYDAIYICGGNTYFILDRMRKAGLITSLNEYIKNGGLYVGISAGSIIAGKDISIAGWGSEGDSNEIGLTDFKGIGFTDISIFPHFRSKLKKEVDAFKANTSYKVEALKDGEALIVQDTKVKKISK